MENPIFELKKQQVALAAKIRSYSKTSEVNYDKELDSENFRHYHIAYCELRGKTRSQIEKPREGNEPSQFYINKIKSEWMVKIGEWRANNE